MSVPEGKRGLSGVQFIDTAFILHMYSMRETAKFGKSWTFRLANPICEGAYQVFRNAKMANSVRVTDRESYQLRHGMMQKAYAELQVMISLVDEAYNLGLISDGICMEWSRLMKAEEKWLNAARKAEEQRYKKEMTIERMGALARAAFALVERLDKVIALLTEGMKRKGTAGQK